MSDRFNLELGEGGGEQLRYLQEATKALTRAEAVRDALTIYKLLVDHTSEGNRIYIGPTRHDAREIIIPALDRIRQKAEEANHVMHPEDLRIETYRSGYVNRADTAVKVTHLPSGLSASSKDEKGRLRNKAVAIRRLREKLKESKWEPTSKPT